MGAVQKLATVVIVGLVALATLLVIYLADEPNRMAAESVNQEEVAIERGIQTYIANCVVCHGPAGEGYSEPGAKGTGRIGMPLGGDTELGQAQQKLNQSEDPVTRQERYDLIVKTINNGRNLMPAFGSGAPGGALLNDEQIHELALMIQNVNWNLVYNDVIAADGGYPTFPPAPETPAAAPAQTPAPAAAQTTGGGQAAPAGTEFTVTSHDIYFDPKELTIPANTDVTIHLPNEGVSAHDFSIDALGISVALPAGETDKSVVINAPPGDYEYYCNVPGHKEAGMIGTLHVVEGGAAPAAGGAAAPAAASPAAEAQQAAAPAAAAAYTVTSHDIYFDPKELTIPADTAVTIHLPNEGVTAHDFSIDALGIAVPLPAGETDKTVVITAPAGDYEYYCNVPGHKEAGMVGTMHVK